jgi:hypothetical protein
MIIVVVKTQEGKRRRQVLNVIVVSGGLENGRELERYK